MATFRDIYDQLSVNGTVTLRTGLSVCLSASLPVSQVQQQHAVVHFTIMLHSLSGFVCCIAICVNVLSQISDSCNSL